MRKLIALLLAVVTVVTTLSITAFARSNQIRGYVNGKEWTARHTVYDTYADCTILYDGNSDVSVQMTTKYFQITKPTNKYTKTTADEAYRCAGCTFFASFGYEIECSTAYVLVVNGGTTRKIITTP